MIGRVLPDSLHHNLPQLRKRFHLPQHHTGTRRAAADQRDIGGGHGPPSVVPPVGASPWDRRSQRDVKLTSGMPGYLDRGQVRGVQRVWQPVDLRLPAHRRQCHDGVVQRRTTTQQQIPAVWVGVGHLPFRVDPQLQVLRVLPPPWLGVVNRRCPSCEASRRRGSSCDPGSEHPSALP